MHIVTLCGSRRLYLCIYTHTASNNNEVRVTWEQLEKKERVGDDIIIYNLKKKKNPP